jgi:hypothetical protein
MSQVDPFSRLVLVRPWNIQYAHVNLLNGLHYPEGIVDNDKLKDEIHALHCLTHEDDVKPVDITAEISPEVVRVRDEVIAPLVKTFIRDCLGMSVDELRVDSFAKWFTKGQELGAHLHGGTGVTTVYYPDDTSAPLTLFDPRFNASRGYPREVRDNHFGNRVVFPKAGDLLILPSYILHSVASVKEENRLSLVNDFSFTQD